MELDRQPVRSEYRLNEDNELRLEIGNEDVIVELVEGVAEVFGTPLAVHKRYTFPPGFRCSIFTYQGALVEIIGKTESAYIATQTPMAIYLNTHYGLEMHRQIALKKLAMGDLTARGPRILLTGPMDVGKSTVSRILLNYAIRFGHTPIYVDLDPGQGQISIPGTVSALLVCKPADIVENFDRTSTLAFSLGSTSPALNIEYYKHLIQTVANLVDEKCAFSPRINASGVVINTCGWIKDSGYHALLVASKAFKVDIVVVLDNELLFNNFKKDLPNFVKIVHEPKSGGVEVRSTAQRAASRNRCIQNYFYGTKHSPFHPFTIEFSYAKSEEEQELYIARVGTDKLPDSCLPFGMTVEDHRTKVVRVSIDSSLKDKVLALMPANAAIDQSLISTPAIGFIVITDVDVEKKTFTILSPQPQPLPTRLALYTDVSFIDDS
uniref:Protein CLP1 homolog n=1 Tax=Panagrolaimus superbus TaxID=310955 RepID=A0A914Z814_9BILA